MVNEYDKVLQLINDSMNTINRNLNVINHDSQSFRMMDVTHVRYLYCWTYDMFLIHVFEQ
jgi:hypothetical protein